jgi:hypothetical protein
MRKPCEDRKTVGGVIVDACSSDGASSVCTLTNRKDVKHVVTITNWNVYPVRINCEGKILNDPRKVEFNSPRASDTATSWSGVAPNVLGYSSHMFDHAKIFSVLSGQDEVDAEVRVYCHTRNNSHSVQLQIKVMA